MRRMLLVLAALALLPPSTARAEDDRVTELERKVDVLTQEIEALRMGGAAAETTRYESRFGLGPAASKVYAKAAGVSLGGYGEFLLEHLDRRDEGGAALAGPRSTLDALRAVLYVGAKFSDQLLLNSEIELEHGGVFDAAPVEVDPATGRGEAELSGEVTLEFAYVEWTRSRSLGVRAGKLLVPLGLTNEMHEPPVFLGAHRPETESFVIPTTWAAKGAGLAGEARPGIAWRAYVLEGLDAAGFTADGAIREGRQETAQALVTHPAFAGRLDWIGTPGLLVGASGFTGVSWQGEQPGGGTLSPRVTLWDVHGRLDWRGVQARALYAWGTVSQAPELSSALGVAGTPEAIGEHFFGGYLEAGYDVLGALRPGAGWGVIPYARYEEYDTQEGVIAPGAENPAYAHRIVTAGAALKPHPNVVLKADREWRHNEADRERDRWSLALGYLF